MIASGICAQQLMYYLLFDDDDVLFLSVSTRFIDEKALKCAGDLKANAYCVTE